MPNIPDVSGLDRLAHVGQRFQRFVNPVDVAVGQLIRVGLPDRADGAVGFVPMENRGTSSPIYFLSQVMWVMFCRMGL